MFHFLKRLFVPTRFDAICFAVAIHWIVAVLSVTVLPVNVQLGTLVESSFIVAIAAATWLAIAATIGWDANSKRGTLCLLISSVVSLVFVVVWYCSNTNLLSANSFRISSIAGQQSAEPQGFLLATLWIVFWALFATVTVWLTNWIGRFAVLRLGIVFTEVTKGSSRDRTKWLIAVAAVLFVLTVGSRVLPAVGAGFSQQSAELAGGFGMSVLVGVFVWAIVLFWFPRSFAFKGKPLQKAVSILLVFFTFLPFLMNLIFHGGNFSCVIALMFGIVFVLSVIGIGGHRRLVAGVSVERKVAKAGPFPSLISCVAAILVVLSLSVPWFYDLTILASSLGGKADFTETAELSSKSAMIKWKSGGRVTSRFDESNQVLMWVFQFDDDAPSDLVGALEGEELSYIELRDLTPEFDLSALSGMVKFIKLTNCEISHAQLSVLLGSAGWGEIEGKFSVVDDGTVVDAGSINSISFRDTKPGTIQAFFDAAKCEDQMTYTITHTRVGIEDWSAIEKVAQSGGVYLYGGLAIDFRVPKSNLSLSRVFLANTAVANNGIGYAIPKELVLDTDIRMQFPSTLSPELQWKLMMLRGSAVLYGDGFNTQESGKSVAEFAKDVGMAYQVDDDGTIHSLYYPSGSIEASLGGLTDLKVLSFDPDWIGADSFGLRAEPVNTAHFKLMTSLEELYFEQIFIPDDLSFLAEFKSLKHLQIPSIVRKVTGPIGFDACQSLESVTFLGVPDNKSYHEISRLKNLKRFVIVNVDEDPMLSQRYLKKLQEKLPEVDVKILSTSEFKALIPKPFIEHRDRVRRELRADTTWLDEVLQ